MYVYVCLFHNPLLEKDTRICDPLWEKVRFGRKDYFEKRMKKDGFWPLGVNYIIYTVENFNLSPTFSCKSSLSLSFLALTVSTHKHAVRVSSGICTERKFNFNERYLKYMSSQGLQRFCL